MRIGSSDDFFRLYAVDIQPGYTQGIKLTIENLKLGDLIVLSEQPLNVQDDKDLKKLLKDYHSKPDPKKPNPFINGTAFTALVMKAVRNSDQNDDNVYD